MKDGKYAYSGYDGETKNDVQYGELAEKWMKYTRIRVKESTCARYEYMLNIHIAPEFGKYKVSEITTEMIQNFVERMLETGRRDGKGGLSPKTVRDMISILKQTFDYADSEKYWINCRFDLVYIRPAVNKVRVLSKEEQRRLEYCLVKSLEPCRVGILLSLYTGMRIGELCALKWETVSLEESSVQINGTLQRIRETKAKTKAKTKVIISEPKSRCSARKIPVPRFLIPYLQKIEPADKKQYLLSGTRDYMEPRTLQNRYRKIIEEADIPYFNYHALRHTFATRCVESGFEIKSLSEILGHSSVNITLNRYVHVSFEVKQENMKLLQPPVFVK